jgi:NDP-sugar pyrophosphorylase family protein
MDHGLCMKAMVLCAGFGTRLGDLTRELPKPMLPISGQPLLAYVLNHLKTQGFSQIAVNLHYQAETIRNWFGDGSRRNFGLTYSYEESPLGTAGGVKKLEAFFQAETAFLVQYGDVLTDQDFRAMVSFHQERGALATLLVHQRANSNSVVSLATDGQVIGFLERPTEAMRQAVKSPWVNSGVCVCSPEILNFIPANKPCDLPRDVFTPLISTARLYGFPLSGYRCAIDSVERLAEARAAIFEGRCRTRPLTMRD